MTKADPTQTTFNAGPNADAKTAKKREEYKIGGNVAEEGQDPSPDDRERGETSDKG